MVRTRSSAAPVTSPLKKSSTKAKKPKSRAKATRLCLVEETLNISATKLNKLMQEQKLIYEDQGWLDLSEKVCHNMTRGRFNFLVLKYMLPV